MPLIPDAPKEPIKTVHYPKYITLDGTDISRMTAGQIDRHLAAIKMQREIERRDHADRRDRRFWIVILGISVATVALGLVLL